MREVGSSYGEGMPCKATSRIQSTAGPQRIRIQAGPLCSGAEKLRIHEPVFGFYSPRFSDVGEDCGIFGDLSHIVVAPRHCKLLQQIHVEY